jgi:hypothetical protein
VTRASRQREADAGGLTVRLDRAEHLFTAPEPQPFDPPSRLVPGIEEIFHELRALRLRRGIRITIELSGDAPGSDECSRMRQAIARYCEHKRAQLDRDRRALEKDGVGALWIGTIILAVGLLLSEAARRSTTPAEVKTFLADGLFLVVAWVGLWYPLDTLIFTRRTVVRECRVTDAVINGELVITGTVRPGPDADH